MNWAWPTPLHVYYVQTGHVDKVPIPRKATRPDVRTVVSEVQTGTGAPPVSVSEARVDDPATDNWGTGGWETGDWETGDWETEGVWP